MIETIYFDARHHVVGEKQRASFRLDIIRNPDEHEEGATKRQWKDTAVTVRKSNFRMCQGSISIDFFHGETVEDTSIVFLLYFMARTRTGQHAELVGFALCDEEDDDDDDDDDDPPGATGAGAGTAGPRGRRLGPFGTAAADVPGRGWRAS